MQDLNKRLMHTIVGSAILALAVVGCDAGDGDSVDESQHEWLVDGAVDDDVAAGFTNPVIAVVDGALAGKIEFLDESRVSGSGVGVVAIGAEGRRALHLLDSEGASPLELFLALAPADAVPPAALVRDHAALADAGDVDELPRALVSPRETDFTDDMCSGPPDEHDGFNTYWNSWSSGFGATNSSTTLTSSAFNIVTSVSTKRALASCMDTGSNGWMRIQKQDPTTLVYSTIYNQGSVCHRCGVAYRSSTPSESTRYREVVQANSPELFYAAASW